MIEAQNKIKATVEQYKKFYMDEYIFVCNQIKQRRENQDKFASTKMDFVERGLTDVPEVLFGLLMRLLSDDEMQYYSSKEGTLWFAKTFPEFRLGDKL